MKDKNNQGSGNAGQPGETTAGKAGAGEASQDSKILTRNGVASLLKSEFAESAPEEPKGEGIQPEGAGGRSPVENADEPEAGPENERHEQNGGQTAEAEGEVEQENVAEGQGETEGEVASDAGEEHAAQPELPGELQDALQTWETQGGGELPPVLQALVEKRIGKLTAQRETEKTARESAEARVQALETEMAQLRAGGDGQLGITGLPDEKTLEQQQRTFRRFVDDAEAYLDESATDEERARVERYLQSEHLDAAGLRRQVRQVNRTLQEMPQQRQQIAAFRQQESAANAEAKKHFPWIDSKTSPEYQMAQEALRSIPDLPQRTPMHRMVLGIYVLGLKEFNKLSQGASKTAPVKARVPVKNAPAKPPVSGSAPPNGARSNGKAAAEESARQRFAKAPTRENAAELLKMGFRN